jgi:serine/threonine protein kinase
MGEVWEAEQTSLGRIIAVKRLHAESDSGASHSLLRESEFRSESAIAGSLEHPNILPVYDLGRAADGSLLLAMKRVHGKPWKELLEAEFEVMTAEGFLARHVPILVAVTQAVAFAHSRGIIHRDIKPAQVLVGEFGEVLLTDWGLAIQADADAPASSSLLRMGAPSSDTATNPAGTPSLMAPEQTENHGGNLGAWTDVYLLGGTLYYLLTGTYPHAAESSEAAFAHARSGEVQAPGARVPQRPVPAELETLCLQALAPDRNHRIPAAAAFLKGLQDYLSGAARKERSLELSTRVERQLANASDYARFASAIATLDEAGRLWPDNPAIADLRQRALHDHARFALQQGDLSLARLQSESMQPGERSRKLREDVDRRQREVSRRRSLLRAATITVCGLLGVIALGALVFSSRMRAANAEIAQRAQEAEDALRIASNRGSGAFSLINFVLNDLKTAMDAELTPNNGITFDTRNEISQAIAGKVAGPVVDYFAQARPESWPRDMQLEHAAQMLEAGRRFNDMARFDEARKLLQPALATRERLLGKESIEVAEALVSLATTRREAGEFAEAEAMNRRAIAISEARLGPDSEKTAGFLIELADVFGAARTDIDQLNEAEALYRRAAGILDTHHDENLPHVLMQQGRVLDYLDRPADAEVVLREALDLWQRTHAADDPDVAYILSALANAITHQDRLADRGRENVPRLQEAEALLRRSVDLLESRLGPNHPDVLDRLGSLGAVLRTLGKPEDGMAIFRKVIAGYEAIYGPDNFRTGRQVLSFGFMLRNEKHLDEAERVLRRATRILETSLGPDYLEVGWGYQFLGFVLKETQRPGEAKVALQRSIEILSARRGPDHPETMKSKEALAEIEGTQAGKKR